MISISFISGTGFMKCMPMKSSGRSVAAARRVIEMEDVFAAADRVPRLEFLEELWPDLAPALDKLAPATSDDLRRVFTRRLSANQRSAPVVEDGLFLVPKVIE